MKRCRLCDNDVQSEIILTPWRRKCCIDVDDWTVVKDCCRDNEKLYYCRNRAKCNVDYFTKARAHYELLLRRGRER